MKVTVNLEALEELIRAYKSALDGLAAETSVGDMEEDRRSNDAHIEEILQALDIQRLK